MTVIVRHSNYTYFCRYNFDSTNKANIIKAIVLTKASSVEDFKLSEIEEPGVNANEVLVKTKIISINPADGQMRIQH